MIVESPLLTDASAGTRDVCAQTLKALRPTVRPIINAQDLKDILLQSIGNDKGRLGEDELSCARDAAEVCHL